MPEDMKAANEIVVPAELESKGQFSLACSPEVTEMHTKIWTELQK
jgi:spermidine/putrescine transport system substrate-binding protein